MPHAFWMVWEAKKRLSEAEGSKVPSCGVSFGGDSPVGYLKRNITP